MMTLLLVGYCLILPDRQKVRGSYPELDTQWLRGQHKQIKKQRAIHSPTRQET